jgi:hypothetical protein
VSYPRPDLFVLDSGAYQVDMNTSGTVARKVEGVTDDGAIAVILVFAVIEIAGSCRELIEVRVFNCIALDEGSNGALDLST